MKKNLLLSLLFMATFRLCAFGYDFQAVTASGHTLYFNLVNGEAHVTHETSAMPMYSNLAGDLVIPADVQYQGVTYQITRIEDYAFCGVVGLTSVVVGDNVSYIGVSAFSGCNDLAMVEIGPAVDTVGNGAFRDCQALQTVVYNAARCTYIPGDVFHGCLKFDELVIGAAVRNIPENAFAGYIRLYPFDVPSTVDTIGRNAFRGVKMIHYSGTAEGCPWGALHLNGYYDPNTYMHYTSSDRDTLVCGSRLVEDILYIPNQVVCIGKQAFYGCDNILMIVFSNSLASIGDSAFCEFKGYVPMAIPPSVGSIGEGAFAGCYSMPLISVPSTVTSIGDNAFASLRLLQYDGPATGSPWGALKMVSYVEDSLYFTSSAKDTLLSAHPNLVRARIPSSVVCIEDNAFYYNLYLDSVQIPNTVTRIGKMAFAGCIRLNSVTLPDSLTYIGDYTFYMCSNLMSMPLPATLDSIGYAAFIGCQYLLLDSLPGSLTSIGDFAFHGCRSTTVRSLPRGLTRIGAGTFYNCRGAGTLSIHDHITHIGDEAFRSFQDIGNLIIGPSVEYIGARAFMQGSFYSLTVNAMQPPALGEDAFGSVHCPNVIIPCGAGAAYRSDPQWGPSFSLFYEDGCPVLVTAVAADTAMGAVEGGGSFALGDEVCLTAVPKSGFRFVRWQDGHFENPRCFYAHESVTHVALFVSLEGIGDVEGASAVVRSAEGRISVAGAGGARVSIYDAVGHLVAADDGNGGDDRQFEVPARGVYLVKVGSAPARKVVVF
ncbi:MAG: leucine-rich repeat domain-containing protein [Bacteroidales bacterium]|nr:leucine-rich repeat domain-containing protein [Bacteroidales bacterium]